MRHPFAQYPRTCNIQHVMCAYAIAGPCKLTVLPLSLIRNLSDFALSIYYFYHSAHVLLMRQEVLSPGEGLRITRPGGGHILPPLLSRLPETLETRNLGGG